MKGIYKALTTALRGDTTLQTLTGYTTSNKCILAESQLKEFTFTKGVLFGRLTFDKILLKDTSAIRSGYFYLISFDKEDSINCIDINERVIDVVNNLSINETDVYGYSCLFDGFQTPLYFDAEFGYYRIDSRFRIIVRKK